MSKHYLLIAFLTFAISFSEGAYSSDWVQISQGADGSIYIYKKTKQQSSKYSAIYVMLSFSKPTLSQEGKPIDESLGRWIFDCKARRVAISALRESLKGVKTVEFQVSDKKAFSIDAENVRPHTLQSLVFPYACHIKKAP